MRWFIQAFWPVLFAVVLPYTKKGLDLAMTLQELREPYSVVAK